MIVEYVREMTEKILYSEYGSFEALLPLLVFLLLSLLFAVVVVVVSWLLSVAAATFFSQVGVY